MICCQWDVSTHSVNSAGLIPYSYVSREHPRDSSKHKILGVQQVKPAELAQQMTLDIGNSWGILYTIIDTCLSQPPGKYLILKDPNQVWACIPGTDWVFRCMSPVFLSLVLCLLLGILVFFFLPSNHSLSLWVVFSPLSQLAKMVGHQ